jgi:hemerythrin-like domain-containing protein
MHLDHEQARSFVRQIQEALDREDSDAVSRHLRSYRNLLEEHIQKEDEVLYPWIDRSLSVSQVGELYSAFTHIDERFGDEPQRHERYIRSLEETFDDVEGEKMFT